MSFGQSWSSSPDDYIVANHESKKVFRATYNNKEAGKQEPVLIRLVSLDLRKVTREHVLKSVQSLTSVIHPGTARVFHTFLVGEVLWVIQDPNSPGESQRLPILIGEKGLDDEKVLRAILRQLLAVLVTLHQQNIFWGDVRGHNLFLRKDGRIEANLLSLRSVAHLKTRDSLPFFSPETLKNTTSTDVKSDIWGFGITALQLLNGSSPFKDVTSIHKMVEIFEEGKSPLECAGKETSTDLGSMLRSCFKVDPKQRPSARALLSHPFFSQEWDEASECKLIQNSLGHRSTSSSPTDTSLSVSQVLSQESTVDIPLKASAAISFSEGRARTDVPKPREKNLKASDPKISPHKEEGVQKTLRVQKKRPVTREQQPDKKRDSIVQQEEHHVDRPPNELRRVRRNTESDTTLVDEGKQNRTEEKVEGSSEKETNKSKKPIVGERSTTTEGRRPSQTATRQEEKRYETRKKEQKQPPQPQQGEEENEKEIPTLRNDALVAKETLHGPKSDELQTPDRHYAGYLSDQGYHPFSPYSPYSPMADPGPRIYGRDPRYYPQRELYGSREGVPRNERPEYDPPRRALHGRGEVVEPTTGRDRDDYRRGDTHDTRGDFYGPRDGEDRARDKNQDTFAVSTREGVREKWSTPVDSEAEEYDFRGQHGRKGPLPYRPGGPRGYWTPEPCPPGWWEGPRRWRETADGWGGHRYEEWPEERGRGRIPEREWARPLQCDRYWGRGEGWGPRGEGDWYGSVRDGRWREREWYGPNGGDWYGPGRHDGGYGRMGYGRDNTGFRERGWMRGGYGAPPPGWYDQSHHSDYGYPGWYDEGRREWFGPEYAHDRYGAPLRYGNRNIYGYDGYGEDMARREGEQRETEGRGDSQGMRKDERGIEAQRYLRGSNEDAERSEERMQGSYGHNEEGDRSGERRMDECQDDRRGEMSHDDTDTTEYEYSEDEVVYGVRAKHSNDSKSPRDEYYLTRAHEDNNYQGGRYEDEPGGAVDYRKSRQNSQSSVDYEHPPPRDYRYRNSRANSHSGPNSEYHYNNNEPQRFREWEQDAYKSSRKNSYSSGEGDLKCGPPAYYDKQRRFQFDDYRTGEEEDEDYEEHVADDGYEDDDEEEVEFDEDTSEREEKEEEIEDDEEPEGESTDEGERSEEDDASAENDTISRRESCRTVLGRVAEDLAEVAGSQSTTFLGSELKDQKQSSPRIKVTLEQAQNSNKVLQPQQQKQPSPRDLSLVDSRRASPRQLSQPSPRPQLVPLQTSCSQIEAVPGCPPRSLHVPFQTILGESPSHFVVMVRTIPHSQVQCNIEEVSDNPEEIHQASSVMKLGLVINVSIPNILHSFLSELDINENLLVFQHGVKPNYRKIIVFPTDIEGQFEQQFHEKTAAFLIKVKKKN